MPPSAASATEPSRTPGAPAAERELRAQGRATMARLLDAGLVVLAERGYRAARVDDVVSEAELSHGTFYLYFSNKEDLFRALATECRHEMKALAKSLGPITPDAAGRAELVRWSAAFIETYRRYGAVIRAWMEGQLDDRKLVRLGFSAFMHVDIALGQRLAEAAPPHLPDLELATTALLAMVERYTYFTTSRDLGVDDATAATTLATMVHRGFFGAA